MFERTEMHRCARSMPGSGVEPCRAATWPRVELFRYAQQLSASSVASSRRDDVWTLIARAELDDADGNVTRCRRASSSTCSSSILAIAGSETTRNALSQGLMALLDASRPARVLRATIPTVMPTAADEIIRWASPVLFFGRSATRGLELGWRDDRGRRPGRALVPVREP